MAVQSTLDAKLFTILDHRPTASPALITISLVIINIVIIIVITIVITIVISIIISNRNHFTTWFDLVLTTLISISLALAFVIIIFIILTFTIIIIFIENASQDVLKFLTYCWLRSKLTLAAKMNHFEPVFVFLINIALNL